MNWAVVMAGGPGTRFWPESRTKRPKPFLKLLGKQTLIEETVRRLKPLFPARRILLVIQEGLVQEAKRLLPEIPRENILGEPVGRNTAPCCVWAAAEIGARDPRAKVVFLPADQYIQPKPLYLKTLKAALEGAEDKPVLLGFRPTSPSPAFGYLEVQQSDLRKSKKRGRAPFPKGRPSLFSVVRFREKPSPAQARQFLKKGNFFWNGGTFAWRLDTFKQAIRTHLPRLYPAFEILAPSRRGGISRKKLARVYRRFPSISLDYGVMEKMKKALCLLAPFQWSDLGGWLGLAQFWPADRKGNRAAEAHPLFMESGGNIVKGNRRLITLLGVHDLVIIDTADALLICPKSKTEQIRQVVRELKKRKADAYL